MQEENTSTVQTGAEKIQIWLRKGGAWVWNSRAVPYLYLCVALATVLLVCFITPPLQTIDESRHFVRAVQIAQGGWLSEIDSATGRGGGVLPEAVGDFVRRWMNTESLQSNEELRTIRERMRALGRESQKDAPLDQKRFVEFPSSGIYPPALYIPQSVGIRMARFFSDKVYVWFYAARVCNAICAVLIIFTALHVATQHQLLLIFPAALPMSWALIASLSSDASIISLSVLFVALCIRFLSEGGLLTRFGLVLCLLLLVLGKPVHLAFGLLLLAAHPRLGWRRAISFCGIAMGIAVISYLWWFWLVRPFITIAGEIHGQNPSAQVRFIIAHPISFIRVMLVTLHQDAGHLIREVIGVLGWEALALPRCFYIAMFGLGVLIFAVILVNLKQTILSRFILSSFAGLGLAIGVLLAAYILWSPPEAPTIVRLEGRYFLPGLAVIALVSPPIFRFTTFSRIVLAIASIGYLIFSAYLTVRILDHYYFPRSILVGKNMHGFFNDLPSQSCPASVQEDAIESGATSWFDWVITGTTANHGSFRVIVATDDGRILGESDPVLTGADFPFVLLPGSSRSRWRMHIWYLNKFENARLWLIRGNTACSFGPQLEFTPVPLPDA